MKYLFLFCICIFASFQAIAQKAIDLDFTLLEPANGAFVQPGVDFKFVMKIKNLSTEAITMADTLWIYLLLDGDTVYFQPVRTTTSTNHMVFDHKSIKANDSITFWNLLQLPMSKFNKSVQFCLSVMPHNGQTLTDTILTNNGNCATIKARQDPANVQQLSIQNISVYPNPCSDYLIVKNVANTEAIAIFDMKGSLVKTVYPNDGRIDCSDLMNGLYQLRTANKKGTHNVLFSVSH
jgi:hypothetical protein